MTPADRLRSAGFTLTEVCDDVALGEVSAAEAVRAALVLRRDLRVYEDWFAILVEPGSVTGTLSPRPASPDAFIPPANPGEGGATCATRAALGDEGRGDPSATENT